MGRCLYVAGADNRYERPSRPRPLYVVAAGVDWDDHGRVGTERHLATALTRDADVLWIDPPVSCVTRGNRGSATERPVFRPTLIELSPSLRRLRTIGPPGLTRPGIRSITWPLVRAQIKWALRRDGRTPNVFLSCHPHDLLGRWGNDVVNVLYGTDDWLAGADLLGLDPRRIAFEERQALRRADVVLAVTAELAERWRALGSEPAVSPEWLRPRSLRMRSLHGARPRSGWVSGAGGRRRRLAERSDRFGPAYRRRRYRRRIAAHRTA